MDRPLPQIGVALASDAAAFDVSELATSALISEALLTPKPGLVDPRDRRVALGSDSAELLASAAAAAEWFPLFFEIGASAADRPACEMLALVRPVLLQALREMLRASDGAALHRGAVFLLGTLCLSAGRLLARGIALERQALCREAAAVCAGIVERELTGTAGTLTNDRRMYESHGLSGVRGEAQSGFATVRAAALPIWDELRGAGVSEQQTLLQMLLHLIASADDVHLVARGGLAALHDARRAAHRVLAAGGVLTSVGRSNLAAFDSSLVSRGLAPRFSADLLRAAWLLAQFPNVATHAARAPSRDA